MTDLSNLGEDAEGHRLPVYGAPMTDREWIERARDAITKARQRLIDAEESGASREKRDSARDAYKSALVENWLRVEPAITAYLASLPPADGWRTMDSAPKDGSPVLLFARSFRTKDTAPIRLIGWWAGERSKWVEYTFEGNMPVCVNSATHWQPLPKPPETPGEDGG